MEHKNIVATIYLKNGQAVKGMDNFEPMGWDVISLAPVSYTHLTLPTTS